MNEALKRAFAEQVLQHVRQRAAPAPITSANAARAEVGRDHALAHEAHDPARKDSGRDEHDACPERGAGEGGGWPALPTGVELRQRHRGPGCVGGQLEGSLVRRSAAFRTNRLRACRARRSPRDFVPVIGVQEAEHLPRHVESGPIVTGIVRRSRRSVAPCRSRRSLRLRTSCPLSSSESAVPVYSTGASFGFWIRPSPRAAAPTLHHRQRLDTRDARCSAGRDSRDSRTRRARASTTPQARWLRARHPACRTAPADAGYRSRGSADQVEHGAIAIVAGDAFADLLERCVGRR